ncbi:MAG: NIPSNAP family protein [Phycisphaerae bacterium]|nr:NIPSNAP family protein [Phycisphaerae bacterium]
MKPGPCVKSICLIMMICVAATGCKPLSYSAGSRQCLELRHYEFADEAHQQTMVDFLAETAIPAWNRLGVSPVGVFQLADGSSTDLYVLLPHKNLKSVATTQTAWIADPEMKAKSAVVDGPKKDPVYKRFDSALLLAFEGCPKVEVPSQAASRVLQLRIYESHNSTKAKRKIEMFNSGEIPVFRETGLNPVFFGESLVGGKMPNLTYMVGFDSVDAQTKAWDTFRAHPKWKAMSSDPYYADTVSNITNLILKPAKGSQI